MKDHPLTYLAIAATPTLAGIAWYVADTGEVTALLRSLGGPLGVHDVGYLGALRIAWFLHTTSYNLPATMADDWIVRSRQVFLAGYALWLGVTLWRGRPLGLAQLGIPVLLYAVIGGAQSVELLLLPMPFLLLANRWRAYTWTAVAATLGVYFTFHPGMVRPWLQDCAWPITIAERMRIAPWYLAAVVSCWCVTVWCLVRMVRA